MWLPRGAALPWATTAVLLVALAVLLTLGDSGVLQQRQKSAIVRGRDVHVDAHLGAGDGGGASFSGNASAGVHVQVLAGPDSASPPVPHQLPSGPDAAVAAAAAVGLRRQAVQMGLASSRWAPWVLPSCLPNMPSHWAPCRVGAAGESPNLVYGEEIVYPDFSVPQPLFVKEEHAKWWRGQEHQDRYQLTNGRAHFRGQHGQNLVFKNVAYKGTPPGQWALDACMAFSVSHRGLQPLPPGTEPQYAGRAILANTPDSWSYQHFLDRVTKLMTQSEPWRVAGPSGQLYQLRTNKPSVPIPNDILKAALGTEGEVAPSSGEFSAAEMVFSCRAPMSHPYFHERLWELLKLPEPAPLEQRKVVLYLSRSHGGTANGGRRVTNEELLLESIRELLKKRGRGEQLMVFNVSSVPHVHDLVGFFFSNVSAVLGPHGGAWCNYIQFSAPDTFGIEFMPTDMFGVPIWEEASMRQRPFMVLPITPVNNQHDMEVDPALVGEALQKYLGRPSPQPEPQPSYTWDMAPLSR